MSRLQKALFLSDKGYADLKKAIFACTLTNLAMLLPFCVTVMIFSELLTPFVSGGSIQWNHIWMLWGAGIVSAILVFLAAKNDYRKTYIASYKESNTTRLRIAEHLRKLPMNFFNTKDLSELTTNMMADCSSMESLLSSTIPPLIANGITVTLTCILLAFFDWRLALCVFITVPIAFLIIWLSRNHQKKLFEKQVDAKLAASDQVQEYLEGMKIIKSCGLSGSHFSALDKALLAMKKIAIKVEMAVGVFMSSASMILQAGIGITIFVGAVLLTSRQIELLPLLMFLLMVTRIYGPILAILANLSSLLNLNVVTSRMRTLLTTPAMNGNEKTIPNCDIELSHVTFAYNQEDVIKDVSCKIPQGSVTALVGPSGSGKTTLMNLLSALDYPKSGEILFEGKPIQDLPEHDREQMRKTQIGFVFQSVALIPMMTAYENIEFVLRLAGYKGDRRKRTEECLKLVGLGSRMHHMPQELSGGEQQRVSIARALAKNPKLLLCDEPTGALDYQTGKAILKLLQDMCRERGMTVIVITHNSALTPMADRVIKIKNGRVDKIIENPQPVPVETIEW